MQFTFSLYSSLMMEQFMMEGGSSLGMVITLVTVSLLEDSRASPFSLRISLVWSLLRPWAKKLLFSYSTNLGFTERLERLLISTVTLRSSPVKQRKETQSAVDADYDFVGGGFWRTVCAQRDKTFVETVSYRSRTTPQPHFSSVVLIFNHIWGLEITTCHIWN